MYNLLGICHVTIHFYLCVCVCVCVCVYAVASYRHRCTVSLPPRYLCVSSACSQLSEDVLIHILQLKATSDVIIDFLFDFTIVLIGRSILSSPRRVPSLPAFIYARDSSYPFFSPIFS